MPPPRSLLLLRSQCLRPAPIRSPLLSLRSFSDKPAPPQRPSENTPYPPNVSEEAAATAKITGSTPPEIDQGTPVEEILKRDPEAQKSAPHVLKKDLPGSKRSYSTMPPNGPGGYYEGQNEGYPEGYSEGYSKEHHMEANPVDNVEVHAGIPHGAKYPLPDLPLPPTARLKKRYPPIVEQFTNMIMKEGKKARAQSVMNEILALLRTKPVPQLNPLIPIIPSAPPAASLPGDPVAFLQTAIDSVAPLVKIISQKASGGFRDQVPMPLGLRARRRTAIVWIIQAADKRKAKQGLAERLADEILAVMEGRSKAWDQRMQVHRTGTAGRANVKVRM